MNATKIFEVLAQIEAETMVQLAAIEAITPKSEVEKPPISKKNIIHIPLKKREFKGAE